MTLPESVRGWQSTWFYCQDVPTPGQSTGLPPFSFDRVQTPSSLKVTVAERMETNMLVERVVQLINQGMTGMDLLEVFLSRRIQLLQARDHLMWNCTPVRMTPLEFIRRKSRPKWWLDG